MSAYGKLYLLPVPISSENAQTQLPAYNSEVVRSLVKFIAEDAKTARAWLKFFSYPKIETAEILLLNEHTRNGDLSPLLHHLLKGFDVGLMSDAGCPGIADPGAEVVRLAHQKGIEVLPLVGPSSIVLAIMASGFNGQNFAFVGYLPIDKIQRGKKIKDLEHLATKQRQAQFFIETPYRNEALFEALLQNLSPKTLLFAGINIGSLSPELRSRSIADWRKSGIPMFNKQPTVFGIYV